MQRLMKLEKIGKKSSQTNNHYGYEILEKGFGWENMIQIH